MFPVVFLGNISSTEYNEVCHLCPTQVQAASLWAAVPCTWPEDCWALNAQRGLHTTVTRVPFQEHVLHKPGRLPASPVLVLHLSVSGLHLDVMTPARHGPGTDPGTSEPRGPPAPGLSPLVPRRRWLVVLLRSRLGANPGGPLRAPALLTHPWQHHAWTRKWKKRPIQL